VQALQKLEGLPVTGVIDVAEVAALNEFTYAEPLQPDGELNRTEVDVARQIMTVYELGQPRLITTVSTGSGEHYCYDTPKDVPTERVCEIANTPSGRYRFYLHRPGWDVGVLGGLYNPFYFNAGVAVHGYQQVPTTPASHGCVRIPMHIAEYFPTLVHQGDPIYVFGGAPFLVVSREPLPPPLF
jgi:lipoprotein-anchoring transpeptidase ErfK/SrfK